MHNTEIMPKIVRLVSRDEMEQNLYGLLVKRTLPDYFLYLEGSDWLELEKSGAFNIARDLTRFLSDHLARVTSFFHDPVDLMSIGVGNGKKEAMILNSMHSRCLAYYAVDVSPLLVRMALNAARGASAEKFGVISLFDSFPELSRMPKRPTLFCILGNTMSNFEPGSFLQVLRDHLDQGDFLLLDCRLFEELSASEWESYRSQANELFNKSPFIRRGIPARSLEFRLESIFDSGGPKTGQILRNRKTIRFTEKTYIETQYGRIDFEAGETVELGFTYRYRLDQLIALVLEKGFDIIDAISEGPHAILLLKNHLPGLKPV